MTIVNIKALSFEDKVRLLPEKEQSYLQGYVDRALASFKAKQTNNPTSLTKSVLHKTTQ